MTQAPQESWSQCLAVLRGKLLPQSFETWLVPLRCRRFDSESVVLEAPHSFSAGWIEEHYLADIRAAILQTSRNAPAVSLVVGAGAPEQAILWQTPESHVAGENADLRVVPSTTTGTNGTNGTRASGNGNGRGNGNGTGTGPMVEFSLNGGYTFDSLIVSTNNEVACTAARTIAEKPGKTPFNPLFIYGGTGLGKTHILHAVANQCLATGTAKRPLYVTSEQFARDFVSSLKENQTLQFARRYRNVDVLLVDDVQFFEGKERMQEEFFHTFNTLHTQGKQIVLSSDRPPESLGGLQDRLLSRIQWGLVADIQPPDLETRVAICQQKAESGGLVLTDAIAEYIAGQVKGNIRELEGIVKRVLFLVEQLHARLTMDVVEKAVSTMRAPVAKANVEPLTVPRVLDTVANHFRVPLDTLIGKGRRSDVVFSRQVAMYLCKLYTSVSVRAIGAAIGGRDHATVLHACEKIEELLAIDPSLVMELNVVAGELGRPPFKPVPIG